MAVSIMQPVAQEAPRHGEADDATSRNHPCAIGPISEGTIAAPISKTVARAAGGWVSVAVMGEPRCRAAGR